MTRLRFEHTQILEIYNGRMSNVARNERFCKSCPTKIDTPQHLLTECKTGKNNRITVLAKVAALANIKLPRSSPSQQNEALCLQVNTYLTRLLLLDKTLMYNSIGTNLNNREEVLEYVESIPRACTLWTDGSLNSKENAPNDVGAGLYIKHNQTKVTNSFSYKLDENETNNVAELFAIIKALEWIRDNKDNAKQFYIFSDSQICVRGMNRLIMTKANAKMFSYALNLFDHLKTKKKIDVTIVWVKGHCDVRQNEEADKLAKQGGRKSEEECEDLSPYRSKIIKPLKTIYEAIMDISKPYINELFDEREKESVKEQKEKEQEKEEEL